MRYEVEMIEKTRFVIEADDAIQVADFISQNSVNDIKKKYNVDLDTEYDDEVLGVTIKPAVFSIRGDVNEI